VVIAISLLVSSLKEAGMRTHHLILALVVSVLLAACGQSSNNGTTPPVPLTNPDPTPQPVPDPDPAPTPPAPDTTAPTVVSSAPDNNASGVAINSAILISFSEPMNPASVSVSISPSFNLGAATFKSENAAVEFDPPADFSGETTYTVNVSGKDVSGNALTASSNFSFKTNTIRDTTAPGVPQNLNAEAGEGQVKLTWNANTESDLKGYTLFYGTDAGNLSQNTFISKPGTSKTVTGLTNGTKYFFQLAAEDGAGNKSGRSSTVNATPKDVTAPKLLSSTPNNGSISVFSREKLSFKFSEPMDKTKSIPTDLCAPFPHHEDAICGAIGDAQWSENDTRLTMSFTSPANAVQIRLSFGAFQDKAGNFIFEKIQINFSVADLVPPSITFASPAANAVGLPASTLFTLTFSEPMDRAATQFVFKANFGVLGKSGPIPGRFTWSADDKSVTFIPNPLLPFGEFAVWGLNAGAKDTAGNTILSDLTRGLRVIQQVTFNAESYGYGHVLRECIGNAASNCDDTAYPFDVAARIGDRKVANNKYETSRGYLAYKIIAIRPNLNATVVSARWKPGLIDTSGDPFGKLGNLILERINLPQNTNQTYTLLGSRGDFNAQTFPCVGCPTSLSSIPVDLDVTELVRADVRDGLLLSQFRLRFETRNSNDGVSDYVDLGRGSLSITIRHP
jgi:Bacterial Ig-like domain/Fibronectin type III domain